MKRFDFAHYQSDIRDKVTRFCQQEDSFDALLDGLQQTADEAENFIAQYREGDRSLIECGPGCSTCCVVNVSTLLPEGIAIVRYLRQQSPEMESCVTTRLEELWREVRGLDDEDRLFMQRPCAFLDEQGNCSIYSVRPFLCRSISSTDAEACREALAGAVFGEEKAIMVHQFQQQLYETLFMGVGEGLEQGGLDGRSFPLTGLVRYLLRHPNAEAELLLGQRLDWQDFY